MITTQKKRKLTCIGDGDGKQQEMEEDMLQQQDWQEFGHPHGAGRWRVPLEEMPGWKNPVATQCLKEPVGSERLFIAMS